MKLMRNMFATHTDYAEFKVLISANPTFVPSNVDGIAERNGNFLIMEWKRPGEKMSEGQKILLKALARTPKFIVVVIIGDTDNGTNIQEFWQYTIDGKAFMSGKGFGSFKEFYKLWYSFADGVK